MIFNMHNLLCFKIEGMNKRYLNYLGGEYAFFRTAGEVAADVEVIVAAHLYPDSDCRLVDNKYFVKDGYLYCKDRYKVVRWSISMDDLEGKTVVRFSGGIWGEHILKDFIIEPLIGFKLASRGFSILHASAMAVSGAGFVFAGGPGAGKTAAILNLSLHNNVFLSDEITLVSDEGTVYSFPSPIRIYYRNLKDMPRPYQEMTPQQKSEVKIKRLIYILSLGYAKLPLRISAEKLFERTGGVYPLRCLILLTRTKDKDIDVTEIANKKALVEQLVLISEQQFPYWFKYVSAYSSVYPSSQVASYPRMVADNLSCALDKVPCYEIKTPYKFSESHRNRFQQVIQSLGKAI